MELAVSLPSDAMTARWPGGHSSKSRERTREMWEPSFRCTPEHSMHIRTPKLMLAQSGSEKKYKLVKLFLNHLFFNYLPSSGISSCVRTVYTVMCLHTWRSPAIHSWTILCKLTLTVDNKQRRPAWSRPTFFLQYTHSEEMWDSWDWPVGLLTCQIKCTHKITCIN